MRSGFNPAKGNSDTGYGGHGSNVPGQGQSTGYGGHGSNIPVQGQPSVVIPPVGTTNVSYQNQTPIGGGYGGINSNIPTQQTPRYYGGQGTFFNPVTPTNPNVEVDYAVAHKRKSCCRIC